MDHQQQLSQVSPAKQGLFSEFSQRNPQHFFEHMSPENRQTLLQQLKSAYGQIILNYFTSDNSIKKKLIISLI